MNRSTALVGLGFFFALFPGRGFAASAYMVPFDSKQPGEFSVQIPWRLGPEARTCPLLVHGFFGYTWLYQEQMDLYIKAIDVEVNGRLTTRGDQTHTFEFSDEEALVRKAGSGRLFWYQLLEIPIATIPVGQRSRVRVKLHREGRRARGFVPIVPEVYSESPDMRMILKESPYEGEEPGWFLFEVYRSADRLPGHPDFLGGDTHVHTEYTHSSFEFGGPLEGYAAAAKAMGIDWATFTDHGHSFDSRENLDLFNRGHSYPPFGGGTAQRIEDKWENFVERTQALKSLPGRPFVGIVGTEVDVMAPSSAGHQYFCHALVYGHGSLIPGEGPNGIDVKLGPLTLRHGESGHSGNSDVFGNDTLSLEALLKGLHSNRFGNVYGKDRLVVYLAHPINKHAAFLKNRVHIGHWWRWGFDDEPDELPTFYAGQENRLPVSGFQVFNSNSITYGEELDPSIPYWDSILCEGLRSRPVRRNAILGGTDTHGDWTSSAVRSSEPSLHYWKLYRKPDGDGFGSVRTLAACGPTLSEGAVLEALRDGRTVITNGPFVLAGVDRDGDGELRLGRDILPSTREGDEQLLSQDEDLQVTVQWGSSSEFGWVQEVRLIGGWTTGPRMIASFRPSPDQGMGGKTMVTVSAGELPQWSYVRAECVTRSGEDVSLESNGAAPASCLDEIALSDSDPALAEGSVESGHRLLRRVERRAYSNPFWIQKVP